jgi:hypothetical protein
MGSLARIPRAELAALQHDEREYTREDVSSSSSEASVACAERFVFINVDDAQRRFGSLATSRVS